MKKLAFIGVGLLLLVSCGSSKEVTRKTTLPRPVQQQVKKPTPSPAAADIAVRKAAKKNVSGIDANLVKTAIEKTKTNAAGEVFSDKTLEYIQEYAPIAIREMRKFNIPASVTLAQGILESGSGASELAIKSRNHFGIKCHENWRGEKIYHDDDEKQECFRKYRYVATSYQDHSLFLMSRQRYSNLFKLEANDYESWAIGLKQAGYATDPNYPEKLIDFISKYQLYRYDDIGLNYDKRGKKVGGRRPSKAKIKPRNIIAATTVIGEDEEVKPNNIAKKAKDTMSKTAKKAANKAKKKAAVATRATATTYKPSGKGVHIVRKDDTLYSLAKANGTTVFALKALNRLRSDVIYIGQELLLESKVPNSGVHVVKKGETLYRISKKYGLTVPELKMLNGGKKRWHRKLQKENFIEVGQELKLR